MKRWSKFEIAWLIAFSSIAAILSYIWGDTLFGFSVFITGVICVVMVTKGDIWNYAFGLYNVLGYVYLSYINGFFGEVMLNGLYYAPMQVVGYFMWKKQMASDGMVISKKLDLKSWLYTFFASVAGIMIYGLILREIPGQNTPFIDAASTVLSVIAMWLMVKCFTEQWILWIIVNIVSIIMWSYRLNSGIDGAAPMIVMWSAYLLNSVYGYYVWNKRAAQK